jgi:hypothetical protein
MPEYPDSKDKPNRVVRAFRDIDGFDGYRGLYAGNPRLKELEREERQISVNDQGAGTLREEWTVVFRAHGSAKPLVEYIVGLVNSGSVTNKEELQQVLSQESGQNDPWSTFLNAALPTSIGNNVSSCFHYFV